MALRLPTQAAPRRTTNYPSSQGSPALDVPSPSQVPDDESTQWVLFSPSQPSATGHKQSASTERAAAVSDFDSFGGTQTCSVFELDDDDDDNDDEEEEEEENDDGTELDSLDDGLHAFRAPSLADESPSQWGHHEDEDEEPEAAPAVLPTHDGLGSFQASSQTVQNQLWQHEQFNPHRQRPELRLRRQSSVQRHLDAVAEQEQMSNAERERWQRIEKWRMEQSRALLQEVERETRRRRRQNSRAGTMPVSSTHRRVQSESVRSSVPQTSSSRGRSASLSSWQTAEPETNEPFWRRITRKVFRDLIGIDDSVLSVIFGESLPDDDLLYGEHGQHKTGSATTRDAALDMNEAIRRELDTPTYDDQNHWQTKLLRRIAHELGVLVHQLCDPPSAFSTYRNISSEVSNQYAGMPVDRRILDSQGGPARTSAPSPLGTKDLDDSISSPHFSPTLREPTGREHAAQWGIEEDDDPTGDDIRLQQEQEYWERELDITMVFRYLRNRFSNNNSDNNGARTSTSSSSNSSATTTTNHSRRQSQDASRRAAIIRQHHPLVARAQSSSQAQHARRQSQHSSTGMGTDTRISSPLLRQHFQRRPSSSCASQSAKLSTISSQRTMTGSSRNYWDIGGSVESGSAVVPLGGGWGDV